MAVLSLLAACGGSPRGPAVPRTPVTLSVPALDGGLIELTRYRGKPVVLHFFTTWDTGSQSDVDQLRAVASPEVVVVGIALDRDGRRLVAPWRSATGVTYLIGLGGSELQTNLPPIRSVPTTVVLDARGVVRQRFDRPLHPAELTRALAGTSGR
ncbi:MAG TPA: TlpA disulfide reductase family protein [Kofleriaceae bacterium]|nr:TlpA disulfide reductase family protein [Kofleriaceae bacterium]